MCVLACTALATLSARVDGGPANCTNNAAIASGTTSTSAGGTPCGDGANCNYQVAYNPPQPPESQQCTPMPEKCCVNQMQ